MFPFMGA